MFEKYTPIENFEETLKTAGACRPVDKIVTQTPSCTNAVPDNSWDGDLKGNTESAHTFVRENAPGAMLKQKSLHGQKRFLS